MKHFLIMTILIATSCGAHPEEETIQQDPLARQVELREHYCASTTDKVFLARCDKLTFKALSSAFCPNHQISISAHESGGKWSRDTKPCLDDLDNNGKPDSISECSGDNLIMIAQDWISKGRAAISQVNRTIEYLEGNEWVCGEGDTSVTNVWHLQPLLYSVQAYLNGEKSSFLAMPVETKKLDVIATHNKYLIAMTIHAKGRMEGQINSTEKAALKTFYNGDKESCIFAALYHRYHDGDQTDALKAMEFFTPEITYEDGYRGWGSLPYATAQQTCTGILVGG